MKTTAATMAGRAKFVDTSWESETAVTFDSLVGQAVTAARVLTYKVIAAVAKAENQSVFDVLNGYDKGVMSLGICHWTVFLPGSTAELPAFLAYLRFTDGATFD